MATATAEHPIKSIIVNGIIGNEPEPDDNERYYIWKAVRFHNTAVPRAQEEEQAWNAFADAEIATEQAWRALESTPTNDWASAHHRWVLAEHELNIAARRWESAAAAMDKAWGDTNWSDRSLDVYDQIVRHLGVRDLLSAPRDKSHYSLHIDLEKRRREREENTRKTLVLLAT
ncbi:hypothetical protein [Nonomuraea dietziae]|uniref:hypothetical protein n=1 Tax=Nonomuraea dietziae TaxID=65515 RepID=UPI0033EDE65B